MMKRKWTAALAAAVCLGLLATQVFGQGQPTQPSGPSINTPQQFTPIPSAGISFTQVGQASITATSASSRVAMPTGGNYIYVCNSGAVAAFFALGGNTVTAVAGSGLSVAAGQCTQPGGSATPAGFIAAITSAGSTPLVIIVGVVTQPQLGNYDLINPLTLASGTGTVSSQDQINFTGVGVNCLLNVTSTSGSPSYNFSIQGKDLSSGTYYDVVRSSPNATSGNITLSTFPGQPINFAAALSRESFPLPRTWRLQVVVGGSGSPAITATTGCSVLL